MDEIVIPASVLRLPVFHVRESAAFNLGGLGAVIGHELSHAFDPNGMRFDAHGKLSTVSAPWYKAMSGVVDQQASRAGLNAALTSGENVADLAGLYAAHEALVASEEHRSAGERQVGMSRSFFIRWATMWATKMSDDELKRRMLVDPHAPPPARCNGPCSNLEAFAKVFGIKKGDGMYLEPTKRARMWW